MGGAFRLGRIRVGSRPAEDEVVGGDEPKRLLKFPSLQPLQSQGCSHVSEPFHPRRVAKGKLWPEVTHRTAQVLSPVT